MSKLNLSIYTILLVDDVAFARQTLNRVLMGMGQPNVIHAHDGHEALEVLRSKKGVDFVISDFNMPVYNGLQLLKAVRTGNAEVHRALPFAMLTGFSDKHLVDSALGLDVNAFLVKPVSKKTLSDRLTKMLNRGDEDPWLKDAGAYGKIAIEEAEGEAPPPADVADQRPSAPPPKDEQAPAGAPELDPRQLGRDSVMRRLSSLSGKFEDSDIAKEIGTCVDRLIGDNGDKAASRIVSYLDGLVMRKVLKVEDLPKLLSDENLQAALESGDAVFYEMGRPGAEAEAEAPPAPPTDDVLKRARKVPDLKEGELFFPLPDVPPGAVLTRNIHTEDGSLFMTWGTQLTAQIVAILSHLDKMGVLALTKLEPWVSGVYVSLRHRRGGATLKTQTPKFRTADQAAAQPGGAPPSKPPQLPEGVSEKRVVPSKVTAGAVLTRDIYTADGRLYLHAGAQVSPRMVSILNDLDQLGHMTSEVWIRA